MLEATRVFAGSDVTTDKSVRFIFWDHEETGLHGAYSYVSARGPLQGTTDEPDLAGHHYARHDPL